MFVSPFLALMAALVAWPWETRRLFEDLRAWEVSQIALDNAAVRIGRGERAYLEWARALESRFGRLERQHHLWHRCAKAPQTAAKCLPLDRLWEARLQALRVQWQVQNPVRWHRVHAAALAEGTRLERDVSIERPSAPPWGLKNCSLCGGRFRVHRQRSFPWRSRVELAGHAFQVEVKSGKRTYRVRTGAKSWRK